MPKSKHVTAHSGNKRASIAWTSILLALLCVLLVLVYKNAVVISKPAENNGATVEQPVVSAAPETPSPSVSPVVDDSLPAFDPKATDKTAPNLLISETAIKVDDQDVTSHSFSDPIDFGLKNCEK